MENGDVLLLENVRFYPGEEKMIRNWQKNLLHLLTFMSMMLSVLHTAHMHQRKASPTTFLQYPAF